ncbi:hypothetical protein Lal_00031925 [Lupinus albus]|nr:hypothetical protein Lal_00031925 [Lupinus albus]
MDQLYFDGMTFCSSFRFPNLLLKLMGLKPHDRSHIISRNYYKFKICTQLRAKKRFTVCALAYFLHPSNKYPSPDDIDRIICAKIPNQSDDPESHNLVKSNMIHGPFGCCNMSTPCMKDDKCSRYFSKQFQQTIVVDQDDYPVYRRRDNANIVEK